MKLEIIRVSELNKNEKKKVDTFILDDYTNGEFINTIEYLEYHPEDRFLDRSIVIIDSDSGSIKSVMMAASTKDNKNAIISHPGTTFSGIIINRKTKVSEIEVLIDMIEAYYGKEYNEIVLKLVPTCYCSQPNDEIGYTLMRKNYRYGYTALANIIDLTRLKDESTIFEMYNSKRRNQVKKPIKNNKFEFERLDSVDEIIWKNMNQNLQEKFNSRTTHTYIEIAELQTMFSKNIVPYVTNTEDGIYGAFALVYKFKNVFHTQYLDMNYSISSEYPNLYLIHRLINIAVSEGYRYFSFGASTESGGEYLNETLYNYKNGYGGGSILLPKFTKEI